MTIRNATIGERAPKLHISEWPQGPETSIAKLRGNVLVVEVIQVNCPGCFLYGLPQAIGIHNKYKKKGVTVLGLATAFEDYEQNTLANLKLLLKKGEVIGETLKRLTFHQNLLRGKKAAIDGTAYGMGKYQLLTDGNKLGYKIPFPVAMDDIKETKVRSKLPEGGYIYTTYHDEGKTFSRYMLQGTPSTILIDKKGILRDKSIGMNDELETNILRLLSE